MKGKHLIYKNIIYVLTEKEFVLVPSFLTPHLLLLIYLKTLKSYWCFPSEFSKEFTISSVTFCKSIPTITNFIEGDTFTLDSECNALCSCPASFPSPKASYSLAYNHCNYRTSSSSKNYLKVVSISKIVYKKLFANSVFITQTLKLSAFGQMRLMNRFCTYNIQATENIFAAMCKNNNKSFHKFFFPIYMNVYEWCFNKADFSEMNHRLIKM